jgi:prophage regulatory protein
MTTKKDGTQPSASTPASTAVAFHAGFDELPNSAFVRAAQLANNSKRPPAPVPLPFSEQTMWRKVKAGEFPAPKKFGPQITAWNVGEVRAWLKAQAA